MMNTIDLVALQGGRPLAVVEVKRRPIPPEFHRVVIRRLRSHVEATQSQWALLADPQSVEFYRQGQWETPQIKLDTERIVEQATPVRPEFIGRRVLTHVLECWMRMLGQRPQLALDYPALADFIHDIAGADDFVEEYDGSTTSRYMEAYVERVSQQLEERARQLDERERQLDERQRHLEEYEQRLKEQDPHLQPPAEPHPVQRWKTTHREEIAKYRGRHIAIHPERGIIAVGDDYGELDEILTRQGVPDHAAVITYINPMYPSK
jgi:hypothetical protein